MRGFCVFLKERKIFIFVAILRKRCYTVENFYKSGIFFGISTIFVIFV